MLGIVQGRLTYAGKKLQSFPKNPFNEFKIASKIGYDYIELFGEKNKNNKNPIWSNTGIKKYLKVSKKYKIKLYSFCDDYVINHSLSNSKTLKEIFSILKNLNQLKIKKYILPLYGSSKITNKNKNKIFNNLSIISDICEKNNIELLIESNMSPSKFRELKKNINSKNCYFLFDTGNRIVLNRNPITDIYEFNNNIKHIHLKDKNNYNKNVIFGKGKVNFNSIFIALKKIKYRGSFTIESQRGKNIQLQAKKNYLFFKNFINKYSVK